MTSEKVPFGAMIIAPFGALPNGSSLPPSWSMTSDTKDQVPTTFYLRALPFAPFFGEAGSACAGRRPKAGALVRAKVEVASTSAANPRPSFMASPFIGGTSFSVPPPGKPDFSTDRGEKPPRPPSGAPPPALLPSGRGRGGGDAGPDVARPAIL